MSKWVYKESERDFLLAEKVLHREERARFESVFENEFASKTRNNLFLERGGEKTLWVLEVNYKFEHLLMQILRSILKQNYLARSQKEMERFKETVESV